jgi:hypothetical protein
MAACTIKGDEQKIPTMVMNDAIMVRIRCADKLVTVLVVRFILVVVAVAVAVSIGGHIDENADDIHLFGSETNR